MRLLFSDELAPITSQFGFVESSLDSIVGAFVAWHIRLGGDLVTQEVNGGLRQCLSTLLPLVSATRNRWLFVPTRGDWVAFFDNGHQGADAFAPVSYLAELLKCRGLRVVCVPHTYRPATGKGREGSTQVEVYGPDHVYFLNYIRSVSVEYDGRRWRFDASGAPLPFEDLQAYSAPRARDRFTPEALSAFLSALGVSAFEESFYAPDARAILVEDKGTLPKAARQYTLAEARAAIGAE